MCQIAICPLGFWPLAACRDRLQSAQEQPLTSDCFRPKAAVYYRTSTQSGHWLLNRESGVLEEPWRRTKPGALSKSVSMQVAVLSKTVCGRSWVRLYRWYSTDNPPRVPRPTHVQLQRHTVTLNSCMLSEQHFCAHDFSAADRFENRVMLSMRVGHVVADELHLGFFECHQLR